MRIRIFYAVSLLMFPTAMFILFKLRNAFYGVFVDKYKDVSILVKGEGNLRYKNPSVYMYMGIFRL